MDYLTMNAAEFSALLRLADGESVRSVQLSRRDSLDGLCEDGFLVVSIVPRHGETFRVAIGETGSSTFWTGEAPTMGTYRDPLDGFDASGIPD